MRQRYFLFCSILTLLWVLMAGTSWASYSTERIGGADRYETSVLISENHWPEGAGQVVLATGADFADAITGAPLAGTLESPILLTKPDELPPIVAEEIDRLDADLIIVLGGTGAISDNVVSSLKNMGRIVKRVAGKDRYDTARLIAHEIDSHFDEAYVVTGTDFPDALSVSALAATEPVTPILLVNGNGVPQPTKDAFTELGVMATTVVGGDGVIPDEVKNALPGPMRVSGRDRYETSAVIFQMTVFRSLVNDLIAGDLTPDLNIDRMYYASGMDFPDALSGAPAAAAYSSGIVLTDPDTLSFGAKLAVSSIHKNIKSSHLLGGPSAVSVGVENEIIAFSDETSVMMFMTDPETMKTQLEITRYTMDEMLDDLSDMIASMDAELEMEPNDLTESDLSESDLVSSNATGGAPAIESVSKNSPSIQNLALGTMRSWDRKLRP